MPAYRVYFDDKKIVDINAESVEIVKAGAADERYCFKDGNHRTVAEFSASKVLGYADTSALAPARAPVM